MMLRILFLCCALLLPAISAQAELVVVANPTSGIERLTHEEVVNIYLGRYRLLPSGSSADPIDLAPDSPLRERFYRHLVNKNLAEINAYWARLVFSGKTRPPRIIDDSDAALRHVAAHPAALAYVDRARADRRVKIVFSLGE